MNREWYQLHKAKWRPLADPALTKCNPSNAKVYVEYTLNIVYRNGFIHLLFAPCAEALLTHYWRWRFCITKYQQFVNVTMPDDYSVIMNELKLIQFVDMKSPEQIQILLDEALQVFLHFDYNVCLFIRFCRLIVIQFIPMSTSSRV